MADANINEINTAAENGTFLQAAFEVIVSNSKNNDTQNVTGVAVDGNGDPTQAISGNIYVVDELTYNEGYTAAGLKNTNTVYMKAAETGTVEGRPGDHTGLYVHNTYDVNKITDGRLVINFPGKTLGLVTHAGERSDYTELIVGEKYKFAISNFAAVSAYSVGDIFTVNDGVWKLTESANVVAGDVYAVLTKISSFTEGGMYAGTGYVLEIKRKAVADLVETTYSNLVSLKSNSQLIPGAFYRITDYVTKINGTYDLSDIAGQTAYLHYARSAEHPFDLIVQALDRYTLDEHAVATQHDEDDYFEGQHIEQWDIKYTIENDATKYSWADVNNGKGVITYMKDEFGNEAYYDFKNIQFLAYALKRENSEEPPDDLCYDDQNDHNQRFGSVYYVFNALQAYLQAGEYVNPLSFAGLEFAVGANILTCIGYPKADDTYLSTFNADFYYTFDYYENGTHYDFSTNLSGAKCYNNKIGPTADILYAVLSLSDAPLGLSINIFEATSVSYIYDNNLSGACVLNIFGDHTTENVLEGCISNILGDDCTCNRFYADSSHCVLHSSCQGNTFMNGTYNILGEKCKRIDLAWESNRNKFGYRCYNISVGFQSINNEFGDLSTDITLGKSCTNNLFGERNYSIKLGDFCSFNVFGDDSFGNTLAYECTNNTFGNNFALNSLNEFCSDNTFGANCIGNRFGSSCGHNVLYDYTRSLIFGNDCDYITIGSNGTAKIAYCRIDDEVTYLNLIKEAGATSDQYGQYMHIYSGVKGTDDANRITIEAVGYTLNAAGCVKNVALDSNGVLRTWVDADNNEPFIITGTPTSTDFSGYMDKTVEEINAAYEAGRKIMFQISDGTGSAIVGQLSNIGIKSSYNYPSFNFYTIYSDTNSIIYLYTGVTSTGSNNTYSTIIYPL